VISGPRPRVDVEDVHEFTYGESQQQLRVKPKELRRRVPDADDLAMAVDRDFEAALVKGLRGEIQG
jgi:hypothetical protein